MSDSLRDVYVRQHCEDIGLNHAYEQGEAHPHQKRCAGNQGITHQQDGNEDLTGKNVAQRRMAWVSGLENSSTR